MKIMQEEIFGPVVAIDKFSTIDEVVERANCTKYGLAAAVFTKDISRALEMSKRVKAGILWGTCAYYRSRLCSSFNLTVHFGFIVCSELP
jgi:acyl-CoA reductase-like NAD-dependent aldehyde dehydrogenase